MLVPSVAILVATFAAVWWRRGQRVRRRTSSAIRPLAPPTIGEAGPDPTAARLDKARAGKGAEAPHAHAARPLDDTACSVLEEGNDVHDDDASQSAGRDSEIAALRVAVRRAGFSVRSVLASLDRVTAVVPGNTTLARERDDVPPPTYTTDT